MAVVLLFLLQEKSATIESVSWEDGRHESEAGVWFRVDFRIHGCYAIPCSIAIYFYDENRNPLRDLNQEYGTSDGAVATMEEFTPGFAQAGFSRFGLFLPANEFHAGPGKHTFRFKVTVFWQDSKQKYHAITTSEYYTMSFEEKAAESGEVTKLEIDYNRKKDERNGIQVTLDHAVHGMKGRKGRFVVEFYYENNTVVHARGREDAGTMTYAQEFEARWDDADFTAGSHWVPYELFPLKIGRNAFRFKVWLQAMGTDGEWHTLDATRAREFFVNNGELKLAEVWVIEDQPVLLDWEATEEDRRLIEDVLTEFNRRLYDASDGQIRVKRFTMSRMGKHPGDHYDGAFRLFKEFKAGDHGDTSDGSGAFVDQLRPFAYLGTPDKRGDVHLAFERMKVEGPALYSRALVHEFHHAAFGLNDEYGEMKDKSFGTYCAKSEAQRRAWNSCIMGTYQPLHRELCKSDTHTVDPSNPKLNRLDCYTRVQQALKKSLGKSLVVPPTPVEGPHDAPPPSYAWN